MLGIIFTERCLSLSSCLSAGRQQSGCLLSFKPTGYALDTDRNFLQDDAFGDIVQVCIANSNRTDSLKLDQFGLDNKWAAIDNSLPEFNSSRITSMKRFTLHVPWRKQIHVLDSAAKQPWLAYDNTARVIVGQISSILHLATTLASPFQCLVWFLEFTLIIISTCSGIDIDSTCGTNSYDCLDRSDCKLLQIRHLL